MFGNDQQQTTAGAQTQSPSMLDNVSSQDFNGFSHPQVNSPTHNPTSATLSSQPQQFTGSPTTNPASSTPTPTPLPASAYEAQDMSGFTSPTTTTHQTSGPVSPPQPFTNTTVIDESDDNDKSSKKAKTSKSEGHATYMEALTKDSDSEKPTKKASSDHHVDSTIDIEKLAKLKKHALEELEPLVKHLEQKPEDEFKTTMMLIQASDNHTLIDKALTAAEKIKDDQERAQAMLDIVNEINYFSQNNSDGQSDD